MTAKQYREAIAKLGLTQERAGEFFGVSGRNSRRWIAGEYPVPPPVAYCVKMMLDHGIKPGDLNRDFA